MNKLCFLLLIVAFFILFSCKKENDGTVIDEITTQISISNEQGYKTTEDNMDENIILEEETNSFDQKIDIFNFNIFENIGDSVEYYEAKKDYSIVDNTPSNDFREREDPDKEIIVSNNEIMIHFITFNGKTYRYVELLKATDNYILGRYIGLQKEQIIEIFGEERTPWPGNLAHLDYIDDKFELFVSFYFDKNNENKIITKIMYGDFNGLV
jgi:hypothetical protein